MVDGREQWLQQRAYEIWELEGRPNGRDLDHWQRAEREIVVNEPIEEQDASAASVTGDIAKKARKRAAPKFSESATRTRKQKAAKLHP